jgi:hypothetical protein
MKPEEQQKLGKIAAWVLRKRECHWIEGAPTYMVLTEAQWKKVRRLAEAAVASRGEAGT